MKKTKVWAHRGASGYAPENTLDSFELAIEQGADGIELDVQLSRDGEVMVIHDEKIDRVTNGTGLVQNYTWRALKQFNASKVRSWIPTQIPTLQEVYELMRGTGMTINVELKTSVIRYEGIEEKVLKIAKDMHMEDYVVYSSFNHQSMKLLRDLEPGARTGLLTNSIVENPGAYCELCGAQALHPSQSYRRMKDAYNQYQNSGLKLHVWTVNDRDTMKRLVRDGVDAIITNFPDICRKVVDES